MAWSRIDRLASSAARCGVAGAEVDERLRIQLLDRRGHLLGRRLGEVDPQLEAGGPGRAGVAEERTEARDVDPAVGGVERGPRSTSALPM